MGYIITSGPAEEPLSTTEAKLHLRVEVSDDDTLIASIIKAARVAIENYTGLKLVTQTIVEYFDAFPQSGPLNLSFYPVQSLTSITYTDTDGATQTWSNTLYDLDKNGPYQFGPARIAPAYSETYPTTRDEINAVTVTYVAGYGAATAVPDVVKAAMRLLIADMYENRMSASEWKAMKNPAWQALLNYADYKRVI